MYFTFTGIFDKMVEQYTEKTLNNIIYLSKTFRNYFDEINKFSVSFYEDSRILYSLHSGIDNNYINDTYIYDRVYQFHYSRKDLDRICFYLDSTKKIAVRSSVSTIYDKIDETRLKELIPSLDKTYVTNRPYLSGMIEDENFDGKVFTVNQLVTDYDGQTRLSILSIDFNFNILNTQAEIIDLKKGATLLLLNENFNVVYKKGNSKLDANILNELKSMDFPGISGSEYITGNNGKELVIYCRNKANRNLLVEIIPVRYIYEDLKPIINKNVVLAGGIVILFLIMSFIISKSLSTPIKKLVRNMKQVKKGEFNVRIGYKPYSTELTLLIDKFNLMIEEIDRLINEEYKMKIAKKTAELQALQAQVNPHFLYNTLQNIQYMALKRQAYEIDSIVTTLREIMEYCLRSGSNIVTLNEELEYVNKYLLIQRFKYVNKLDVSVDYDDDTGAVMVPRMMLQPLIENCFLHGFGNNTKKHRIFISCKRHEDYITIDVTDNGIGIDPDRLSELREELDNQPENIDYDGEEIGIKNVNTRLKILYKNRTRIEISSIPFKKTTVTIKIPFDIEVNK